MADFLGDAGLDAVEHAGQHRTRGLPDDAEDGERDQQADNRIGKRVAQPDASGAENDGKAGKPIRPSMIAICDQGSALDLAADPDAEHGYRLVAEEANDPGERHPQQLPDRLRMEKAVDGLVAGNDGAEQDDEDDDDTGQVLGPAVAIGEGGRGLAAREHEGDPEGD